MEKYTKYIIERSGFLRVFREYNSSEEGGFGENDEVTERGRVSDARTTNLLAVRPTFSDTQAPAATSTSVGKSRGRS